MRFCSFFDAFKKPYEEAKSRIIIRQLNYQNVVQLLVYLLLEQFSDGTLMLRKIHNRIYILILQSDTLYLNFAFGDRRLTVSDIAEFRSVLDTPLH